MTDRSHLSGIRKIFWKISQTSFLLQRFLHNITRLSMKSYAHVLERCIIEGNMVHKISLVFS